MNNRILTILFCGLFSVLVGCEKPETPENNDDKPSKGALADAIVDLNLMEITATTATLTYAVDLGVAANAPVEVKVRYSVSESFPSEATEVIKLKLDEPSCSITALQFDRRYYYELFLTLYETEYAAVKGSFMTKPVSITLNEPYESPDGLAITGKVNGVSAIDLPEFNASLCLTDVAMGDVQEYGLELAEDFTFGKTIGGLDIGTTYAFSAKASQGTQKSVSSEEKTFTTADPYVAAEKTISGAATDLSANATANCYVVPSSGAYKFKLVKGNSKESVGNVKSVRILWESFGSAVKPVALDLISATCKDGDYAVFEVAQNFQEGNAVIAAFDQAGTILWSWHIWLTAADMAEITYANNAGVMMDRNLGALSATPNDAKTLGLFYQWGRKDPFLGSSSISQPLYAQSTRNLKVITNTPETATLSFALSNPHKFILANEGGDWLTVKDNSLWGSSKTIYDPCPEGWRVPDGGYNGGLGEDAHPDGIWAKAGFSRQGDTAFGPDDNGRVGKMFGAPFCTPQTWYPAAGSIQYATGQLYGLGVDGVYQSVTAYGGSDTMVTGLLFNYFPTLGVHYIYCGGEKFARAGGNSVRCCKE